LCHARIISAKCYLFIYTLTYFLTACYSPMLPDILRGSLYQTTENRLAFGKLTEVIYRTIAMTTMCLRSSRRANNEEREGGK